MQVYVGLGFVSALASSSASVIRLNNVNNFAFSSMFMSVSVTISQTVATTIIILGTYMLAAAASYNCVNLTYMSRLTDFGVCHCF